VKRNLLTLAVVVGGLVFAAGGLRADPPAFRIGIGFGPGGVHVSGGIAIGHGHGPVFRGPRHVGPPVFVAPPPPPRRMVHVHNPVPVYNRVWVPARYETVFVGYGCFGTPIYRTVCVSPGHWETVIAGHRCGGCGIGL
jgi:hypothetical protein